MEDQESENSSGRSVENALLLAEPMISETIKLPLDTEVEPLLLFAR